MMMIIAALLAFVTVAGLGFVFAGDNGQAKVVKRAHSIVAGAGSGGGVSSAAARAERQARAKAAANDPGARRKQILKTLKDQEKQNRKASLTLESRLNQAGLTLSVRSFWIISVAIGVIVLAVVYVVMKQPLIGLGLGFVTGFGIPQWAINALGKARTKKFTEAFSDAIDIIVRGIKSGLPVHEALKIIGRECPEPLAGEFTRLVENIGMGMSMDQALEKMFRRMPTSELHFFTIVLAIQAKTGGNLAEALGNLSVVLRSRKLMREKIKALSSEATASAFIIGCLPPGVVTLIMVTSPGYMSMMFTDQRGQLMLMGGAFWMVCGILVMRKMINFKF